MCLCVHVGRGWGVIEGRGQGERRRVGVSERRRVGVSEREEGIIIFILIVILIEQNGVQTHVKYTIHLNLQCTSTQHSY